MYHAVADPQASKRIRMLKENNSKMIKITEEFKRITQYAPKDYVMGKKSGYRCGYQGVGPRSILATQWGLGIPFRLTRK
jgi:hypothetical protein